MAIVCASALGGGTDLPSLAAADGFNAPPPISASQRHLHKTSAAAHSGPAISATPNLPAYLVPVLTSQERQLESLARNLKKTESAAAYQKLSSFASARSAGEMRTRAALALGYFDYNKGRYSDALRWLGRAGKDPLLSSYALYWSAVANQAVGDHGAALDQLEKFRRDFPESVMSEQALTALSQSAIALNRPGDALSALESDPEIGTNPALLMLRGEAREQAGRNEDSAADYLAVFYSFPLSSQSFEAGRKLEVLRTKLGDKFPTLSLALRFSRGQTLFDARRWRDAHQAFQEIIPLASGEDLERAELLAVASESSESANPTALAGMKLEDPDVDAERLYLLSQIYRTRKDFPPMQQAVEAAVSRAPASEWAEHALFSAGNSDWVQLDLDGAAAYYQRVVENFPASHDADAAHWRLTWRAYFERKPEPAALLEEHLEKYPGSPFTPDAVYWLGRIAERNGQLPLARGFYEKLRERFPESYFGELAAERLKGTGNGPADKANVLALLPPVPAAAKLNDDIGPVALIYWQRARALETIGFDSSAELELRAAYAATGDARLLLDAAEAALASEQYPKAIVTVRQVVPQLESHVFEDLPEEIWRTAYPLPYADEIRRAAAVEGIDPMLLAGLVRQESAFEREAVSHANAYGLSQLLPVTARKYSRILRLGYSHQRLFDPEYNLRIGAAYFESLLTAYGSPEAALAAYNAGEDRVAQWQTGRKFEEPAEFVESIPFSETRDYVQIVTRNASIYRRLYGTQR